MRIEIAIFLLILFVPIVDASTPKFSTTLLLEDDVLNGNIDLGDILFLSQPYESDYHYKQTISNITLQQYDIMSWLGNESIKIRNPEGTETILVKNSEYYFPSEGDYKMISMVNSSINATITSTPADQNKINITKWILPPGMDLNFSEDSFVLNDEKTVKVNLTVDDDVKNGDYDIQFKINDVLNTHSINVLKNYNWTMDISNLTTNLSIKNGESRYLGRIIITNNGNMDFEINTTKSGNQSQMLGIPQPQTLYHKNELFLDFQLQVPTIQMPGWYDLKIDISGGGTTKSVYFAIKVVDSLLPTIEQINFSSDRVYVENKIRVVAIDNNDVKEVTLSFDNQTILLKKDGNLFTESYVFEKLSKYEMEICAVDLDENEVCKSINKTFTKLSAIEGYQKVIKFPSKRYGKYSQAFLFNLTQNVPEGIILQLVSMDSDSTNNNSAIVRIVDEAGSIKPFTEYKNDVKLTEKGKYYIEIRADKEGYFEGILRYDVPEYIKGVQDTTLKVSFKNYDVPKDFTQSWINGRDFVCKVVDTGNLDTTHYKCEIDYPIDLKPGSLSIPTTAEEREKFKQEADDVRKEMERIKTKHAWIITFLIFIPIIILLWGLYMVYVYPITRIRVRRAKR